MARTDKTPDIAIGTESAGHVEFDSRGNSVWRWNSAGGTDSTSILLKRLDNDALQLEPTRSVPVPGGGKPRGAAAPRHGNRGTPAGNGELSIETTRKVNVGGGFNPYDNS